MERKWISIIVAVLVAGSIGAYAYFGKPAGKEPLKILLKDRRLDPSEGKVLSMQPTVEEVWLQREDGTWVKIWKGIESPIVKPDEPAILLAEVYVEEGTYIGIGSNVKVSKGVSKKDYNGDRDANDSFWVVKTRELGWREGIMFYTTREEIPPEYIEKYDVKKGNLETRKQDYETGIGGMIKDKGREKTREILKNAGLTDAQIDFLMDGIVVWPGPWEYDGSGGLIVYDFTIPQIAIQNPFRWGGASICKGISLRLTVLKGAFDPLRRMRPSKRDEV